MIKALKKIDRILVKACDIFLIFTIVVMVLMVVWQVVCRFIIHMSTPYAEEFARLAIVWCILIGGAMAVRSNDHIRVDSLTNILPKPVQFILQLGSYILTFIFAVVILRYSYDYTLATMHDVTTSLGYHRNIFFVPGIFFGVITAVYTIVNIALLIYNAVKHMDYKLR